MLSIFLGNDINYRRQEIKKKIALERKENNFKEVLVFNDANFSKEIISNLLGGGGLFSEKNIIIFDRILDKEEIRDYLFLKIKEMLESNSIFIINEKKIEDDFLKKIENFNQKNSEQKIQILSFDQKIEKKIYSNSGFELADAIASKDRLMAWIKFQKCLNENVDMDQLAGTLFWQAKMINLVSKEKDEKALIDNLKMKPFSINKAKKFAKNFTEKEQSALFSKTLSIFHSTRRGADTAIEIEKMILEIK